jgi:signal transduction histidine kinase
VGFAVFFDLLQAAQQLESLQQAYNERDAACSAAMQAKETAQQELQELRAQIESFKEAEIYHCNLQRRLDEVCECRSC